MTAQTNILPSQEEINQAMMAFSNLTWKEAITAAGVLLAGIVGSKLILFVIKRLIRKGSIEKTIGGFLLTFTRVVLVFVVGIMTADKLGIPVTSLLTLLGMFALAVSLSVQNVLSNLVNGFVILATKPFKAGDFIETSGETGSVEAIDLVYTHLVTVDNRKILIPNSSVTGAQVINYSNKPWRRMELPILVGYDVQDEQVIDALLEAAGKVEGTNGIQDKPPQALLSSYEPTGLKFVLRVWADKEVYWTVHQGLLRQIRRTLAEKNIPMTYGCVKAFIHAE